MSTAFHRTLSFRRLAIALAASAMLVPGLLRAGDEEQIEIAEAKAALGAAMRKNAALEAQLAAVGQRDKAMGESLAAANAEAREYREDYQKIKLQLEALGVDILRKDSRGLDERLLNAVSDLAVAEARVEALSTQMASLTAAVTAFLDSTVITDSAAAARLDDELHAAGSVVADSQPTGLKREATRAAEHAKVVSVKADYGLLVLNIGDRDGVRIGTPFLIHRKDRPVATAMVVDSRSAISGAIITDLIAEGDTVQVGDLARLDTYQSSTN
ncbi:hypothetical protein BH23VER1_BH23VER1_17340 [soil metagenome]